MAMANTTTKETIKKNQKLIAPAVPNSFSNQNSSFILKFRSLFQSILVNDSYDKIISKLGLSTFSIFDGAGELQIRKRKI